MKNKTIEFTIPAHITPDEFGAAVTWTKGCVEAAKRSFGAGFEIRNARVRDEEDGTQTLVVSGVKDGGERGPRGTRLD